jgi:hypothetical protein
MAIRFLPRTPGPAGGQLQVSYDDQTVTVALSGTAIASVFSYILVQNEGMTPLALNQTIDLGDVRIGDNASAVVQFKNVLATPTTLTAIAVNGAGLSILEGPILPVTLQPGQETSVRVRFAPTTPGAVSGRLAIGADTFLITARGIGAQLQLSYEIGGVTQRLGTSDVAAFPATGVGRTVTAQFTLNNQGTGPFSLFTVGVTDPSGSFQLSGPPADPVQVQPGDSMSFTITFTPKSAGKVTGTLDLNGVSIVGLSGVGSTETAVSSLAFSYLVAGVNSPIAPGGFLNFPSTPLTQSTSSQFTITNTSSVASRIVNIGLDQTRAAFKLGGLPALPVQIGPGQSLSFTIGFQPDAPGSVTGFLNVDDNRFNLTASAPNPPLLPSFQFTGASGQQQPFQQPAIGLSLTAPYPVDVQGVLSISTVSDTFAQDPAVRFSNGGQTAQFTIPANTLQARFAGSAMQIQVQTGTVAGSILITPAFAVSNFDITPSGPATLRLDVPRTAPVLLAGAIVSQSANTLSVSIAGYATTRSLQTLNFTFTGENNRSLGQSAVDLSGASRIWFQSAASIPFGGQFSVQLPFTLRSSSDTTNLVPLVREITVQAVNEVGQSNSLKFVVP